MSSFTIAMHLYFAAAVCMLMHPKSIERVQVESEQSSITSSGEIAVFAPDFLYLLPLLQPFLISCIRCCLLTRKFGTVLESIK